MAAHHQPHPGSLPAAGPPADRRRCGGHRRHGNRLRTGPGLGYSVLSMRMAPGNVWYVQAGPVCNNGIHWYQVAAYDAAGWTAEGVRTRAIT